MLDTIQFEEIYHNHKVLVYNLALSYVHNQEDAQDIAQEVFVKVAQRHKSYNPEKSSLKTWIYQITINHCLDFVKAKKSKKRFGFLTGLFNPETNEPIAEASHFDHPGVALEDKEEVQRLFAIIDTLPDNQRTVLILTKLRIAPSKRWRISWASPPRPWSRWSSAPNKTFQKKLDAPKDFKVHLV